MIFIEPPWIPNWLNESKIKSLADADFKPGSVYFYESHAQALREVNLHNFLNDQHYNHLKSDPTSKILMFFPDEYFNLFDIERFVRHIQDKQINPEQIYFLTMDENYEQFARSEFHNRGCNIKVDNYNLLMKNVVIPDQLEDRPYRFSCLSRNYLPWRLFLYIELVQRNLIKDFNFTFNKINPYSKFTYTLDELKTDLQKAGYGIDQLTDAFLNGIPYELQGASVFHKMPIESYRMIQSSSVHILVESHFDPFNHYIGERSKYHPDAFAPAFMTEKTWKVVACDRPFIAMSTPFFIKGFKQLGYKSFSPFINEDYDNIINNRQRLKAIIEEIERLSRLPKDQFDKIVVGCQEITKFNKNLLIEKQANLKFNDDFKWLEDYAGDEYYLTKLK